jgi:hypothetical protein
MSEALYATRLFWNGRQGCARHNGVAVDLRTAPAPLAGVHNLTEIDFAPEVRVAQIRESAGCWRDLNTEECTAVATWLAGVSAAARAALIAS